MAKTAVFTIIAKNYLPHATLFVESMHQQNPDWEIFVFFVDNQKVSIRNANSLNISEINIPNYEDQALKYSLLELSTAVKPWAINWLFDQKYEYVFYFDPDIYIYKPLNFLKDKLVSSEAILTPHITIPYDDDLNPSLFDYLQVGIYNLGFVGFRNCQSSKKYVKWWANQLLDYCYSDPGNFMFTDQKWMDFAPVFINSYIVREVGYNVAYWNLHQYIEQVEPSEIYFLHFSGFSHSSEYISKYQNRFTLHNIGKLSEFYINYAQKIRHLETELGLALVNYRYPHLNFNNTQIPITDSIRKIYRYCSDNKLITFNTNINENFLKFLLSPHNKIIPKLPYLLYMSSPEIRASFPISNWSDKYQVRYYLEWLFKRGLDEYQIHPSLTVLLAKAMNMSLTRKKARHSNFIYLVFAPKDNFLQQAYKHLLFRPIDLKGYERNSRDLSSGAANRFLLLFRIYSSSEYKHKNQTDFLYLTIMCICLLLGSFSLVRSQLLSLLHGKNKYLPSSRNKSTFGINIAGYFTTESGVGDSARGIVGAFDAASIPVNLKNISQKFLRSSNQQFSYRFTDKCHFPVSLLCVNADQTSIVIKDQLPKKYLENKYSIGYWYWESDRFPSQYLCAADALNEVWVATSYVQDIISRAISVPVIKIPPTITFAKSKQFDYEKHGIQLPNKSQVLLNVFDSYSFVERKNPFAIISAFKEVVKRNDNIHLVIKTTRLSQNPDAMERLKEAQSDIPNIHFLDGYLSSEEMESLIQSCNIYISLHKSEGLGLTLIKSMMAGIPTVATGFGGNTDFMTSTNSFLVNYKLSTLHERIGPYPAGTTWAEPDIQHAITQILKASESPKIDATDVQTYFSPERTSAIVEERMLHIFGSLI